MKKTCYYRIEDPIENFKIKITVREISRTPISLRAKYNKKASNDFPYFFENITLSWQEKIYSPFDIADYILNRNNSKFVNQTQLDNHRQLAKLESDGNALNKLIFNHMLYTYIDKDNQMMTEDPLVLNMNYLETKQSYAMKKNLMWHPVVSREKREKGAKRMAICLATDVDRDALLSSWNKIWLSSQIAETEHVLCSLEIDQNGLLKMTPGFSQIVAETDSTGTGPQSYQAYPPSVFLDQMTVDSGLKQGFALETFRIRTKNGTEFEYTLENVNDVCAPQDFEDIHKERIEKDRQLALSTRGLGGNTGTTNWKQDPAKLPYTSTKNYYLELMSAWGFGGEKLFISYEVLLPTSWKIRTGDVTDGIEIGAVAGKTDNIILSEQHWSDSSGMLRGTTQTAQCRYQPSPSLHSSATSTNRMNSAYQYSSTPHSAFTESTRFIWGTLFLLTTYIGLLLGLSYPFWLIIVIVILFILGTGMPSEATQVIRMNTKKSFPTIAATTSSLPPTYHYPIAYFGHLFHISVDTVDQSFGNSLTAPSADMPTIVVQVYSQGWFDRICVEGTGYTLLPNNAGFVDVTISTWKPVGGIRSSMSEFFLGGAARLKNNHFIHNPNKLSHVYTRFGTVTQNTGNVRIRCHIVTTDSRKIKSHKNFTNQALDGLVGIGGADRQTLRRTVEDILTNFRLSNTNLETKNNFKYDESSLQFSNTFNTTATSTSILPKLKQSVELEEFKSTSNNISLRGKDQNAVGTDSRESKRQLMDSLRFSNKSENNTSSTNTKAMQVLARARAKSAARREAKEREEGTLEAKNTSDSSLFQSLNMSSTGGTTYSSTSDTTPTTPGILAPLSLSIGNGGGSNIGIPRGNSQNPNTVSGNIGIAEANIGRQTFTGEDISRILNESSKTS